MSQTPEQIPAEVREIAERLRREIEKDGISAANSIAIGYIEGAVNPRYHWRTDAERVTYVRTLLAALDLALSPVEPHAPTRVDTEEDARAAFALGHLEDDGDAPGDGRCPGCHHEAEHRLDIGCVAQSYSAEPMGRRCGCKYVAGGA